MNRLVKEVPALISLAIPIVAGLSGSTVLSLIDSLMLGPLGEVPLAVASLTQSVLVVFYAGLFGFVGPVGVLAGQAYGSKDLARLEGVLHHGMTIGLAAGIVSAVLMAACLPLLSATGQPSLVIAAMPSYWIVMSAILVPFALQMVVKLFLDAIGRPWISAVLILLPVLLNVPLNYVLIYGKFGLPELGILGAAVASYLSVAIGLFAMLAFIAAAPSMAPYRRAVANRRGDRTALMREGFPMALQYVAEGSAVAIAGVLIGLLGATALAANQIVFSVAVLVYMAPLGLSGAVTIRIAQAIGARSPERVRAIGLAGVGIVVLWMIFFSFLMIGWGDLIARAFVSEPEIIDAAAAMFVVIGIMQVFDGLQSVSLGALRGILDNRWPTTVALISYWGLALPLSIILGLKLGLGGPGVWAGFGIGLAIGGLLFLTRFLSMTRVRRRKVRRVPQMSPAG